MSKEVKRASRAVRCGLCCGVVCCLTPSAAPVAHGRTLVLESHSLPRTKRAAQMMSTVARALGKGVISGKTLAAKLDRIYGRLPRPLPPERRARLLAQLKVGYEASHVGRWDKAIGLLTPIKRALERAVSSISRSKSLFAALQRARLLLSNCFDRSKRPRQARAMMAEFLRAQPDFNVSLAQYPPNLVRLFFRTKRALDRLVKASLAVSSDPPGAAVFLSGRYVGMSPVKLDPLYPGAYELLIIKDNKWSRIQRITVHGHQKTQIAFALHQALRSRRFAGIQLKEAPGRDVRELRYAMDIATRVGADKIILVGLRRLRGREVLVGKAVSLRGRAAPITAYVYVGPRDPPANALQNLGRFLSGAGKPGPGVIVSHRGLSSDSPKAVDHAPPRSVLNQVLSASGWTMVVGGLASAITGGVLLGLHGRESEPGEPPRRYNTKTGGYASLGAGLGSAAIGALLLVVGHYSRGRKNSTTAQRIWIAPTTKGSVVYIGGRF